MNTFRKSYEKSDNCDNIPKCSTSVFLKNTRVLAKSSQPADLTPGTHREPRSIVKRKSSGRLRAMIWDEIEALLCRRVPGLPINNGESSEQRTDA